MLQYNRRINEFTLQQKTKIFYNQIHKNVDNLLKLNIPYIHLHLQHLFYSQHINNLPLCPYCLEFYIFPGKQVASELKNKYNITIEQPISLFSSYYIRPAECDHINAFATGGTNNLENGIFVCSRCNKQKSALNTQNFFTQFLQFDFQKQKYIYNPAIRFYFNELMDIDEFNNKCYSCDRPSEYQICWHCASKKNTIIFLANYNDTY